MHRATRGVCIGVERHLAAGDPVPADLSAAEVAFLVSIGAVQRVPEPEPEPSPAASAAQAPASETPAPAKPGQKEK